MVGEAYRITRGETIRNTQLCIPLESRSAPNLPLESSSSSLDANVETPTPAATPAPTPKSAAVGTFHLGVDAAAGVGLKLGASPLWHFHRSGHSQYADIKADRQTDCLSYSQTGESNCTRCLATLHRRLTFLSLHPGRAKLSLLLRPGRQLAFSMTPSSLS